MAKVVRAVAVGALIVGAAIVTGGVSVGPSLGALTAGAGVTIFGATITATALGSVMLLTAATTVIGGIASQIQGTPTIGAAQLSRLSPSLVAAAYRKIAFGQTAFATDIRYMEPSGTDQEFVDYIVACASHAVESIDEIWFDGRRAWTLAGGVQSFFSGYLTVNVRTEGTAANAIAINGGTVWNTSCRLTGCAYVHFRIKRTGNDKKAESPLPGGLPPNVVIIGRGMRVYDPRRDSTAGGSGSHRANDQSTWQFADGATVLGNNPALQALTYQLGWRIGGKVAVGKGTPPGRLNLAAYAASANLCDETVLLAGGGSQRRYEGGGVFSEGDDRNKVLDTICLACGGEITDSDGRIGMRIAYNDLAGAIVTLTEDDIVGEYSYEPAPALNETINVVRGRYVDASANGLYQLADVPEVAIASPDGVIRPAVVELAMVQDVNRAQRIFKQLLQRAQYPGLFAAAFGPRALQVKRGQVVRLNFWPLGFSNKLFRVEQQTIALNSGVVAMILREENAAIYAWDRDERAGVTPAAPVLFDPRNNPLAITQGTDIGVENGADVTANNQIVVVVPAQVNYDADYLGNINGSITAESIRVSRGGTSIKLEDFVSYSITPKGGISAATVDNTNGSATKGDITGITFGGTTGSIEVNVTVDGVAQPRQIIQFVKKVAAPPASGGAGAKIAYDTSLNSTSSTSDAVLSDVMTVTVASGEKLYGSGALDFEISGTTSASRSAQTKWQYSPTGANSWSDFVAGTYKSSSSSAQSGFFSGGEWIDPVTGFIDTAQDVSVAAGTYDVRLVGKLNASGRTASFFNTVTVEAKP